MHLVAFYLAVLAVATQSPLCILVIYFFPLLIALLAGRFLCSCLGGAKHCERKSKEQCEPEGAMGSHSGMSQRKTAEQTTERTFPTNHKDKRVLLSTEVPQRKMANCLRKTRLESNWHNFRRQMIATWNILKFFRRWLTAFIHSELTWRPPRVWCSFVLFFVLFRLRKLISRYLGFGLSYVGYLQWKSDFTTQIDKAPCHLALCTSACRECHKTPAYEQQKSTRRSRPGASTWRLHSSIITHLVVVEPRPGECDKGAF